MAASDWTFWEGFGSDTSHLHDILRYRGNVWYLLSNGELYVLDEYNDFNSTLVTTFAAPAWSTTSWTATRLRRKGDFLYALFWGAGGSQVNSPVMYRYEVETGNVDLILDVYDQVGFSHPYDAISAYSVFALNEVGFVVGCTEFDISEHLGWRGFLLYSYNGTNWFEGYHDTIDEAGGSLSPFIYEWPYRVVAYRGSSPSWTLHSTTNLSSWSSWPYTQVGNRRYRRMLWGSLPGNPDLWVYSDDGWQSYDTFLIDTGLGSMNHLDAAEGRHWTSANNGLAYFDLDTETWVLDYADALDTRNVVSAAVQGYSGHTFMFLNRVISGSASPQVWKRDRLGGAYRTGDGPDKLSIDRNSNHIYCTTYGLGTEMADYWRVSSDLLEVRLIQQSTVSGIHGAVHSARSSGIHCYGDIDGDLVMGSVDAGITLSGWGRPVLEAVEASTLYTKRDNALPDDVIVTVTVSGVTVDRAYSYPSGSWVYLSDVGMVAEAQVRRDEHTFIGMLTSSSGIVHYSNDGGQAWEVRDAGLPTITITDLEFA